MRKELFEHQVAALAYCNRTRHPALFMEMRLGKTLVTIRALAGVKRILVVAPLSVLASWEEELSGDEEPWTNLSTGEGGGGPEDWFLLNYEALRGRWKNTTELPWGAVVLDESTRIKNPRAAITQICCKGFREVPRRFLLTGLPAPEGPLDYCSQYLFLQGDFLGHRSYWSLRNRFFFKMRFDWTPRKGTNERIKKYVHDHAFVLSRKKAGVGSRKIYEKRVLEQTPVQKKLIREVRRDFSLNGRETKWIVTQHVWLAQIAGGHPPSESGPASTRKQEEIVSLLSSELKGQSIVVFFRFNRELYSVKKLLRQKSFTVLSITGLTPVKERAERRLSFSSGMAQVLLVQIKTVKFGLDLSRADTAIYYSNSFSLEERAQSEDRIVHPQKKRPLLYLDLITKGTTDEDCLDALREKSAGSKFFLSDLLENFFRREG